jgi:hypothetical protein
VAEDLGQPDEIVAGVGKILMRHGVPEQVSFRGSTAAGSA